MKSNISIRVNVAQAPVDPTGALNPHRLDAFASAAEQELLKQGESVNTLRSYHSALRYWATWFALRYHRPIALPLDDATVVQFIVDHARRQDASGNLVSELPSDIDQALVQGKFKAALGPPALTTLLHRVSVLSKAHQLGGSSNPCASARVKDLLAMTRRAYAKRGDLAKGKPALTREPLEALFETCDDSLAGLRDRALLLFAFSSGGRRRSEVTAATIENTRRSGDSFVFALSVSKTNQSGAVRPENDKPIVGRAAQALQAWLAASQVASGPIFRRVRRGGVVGEPLSPAAVRLIVQKRCELAGLTDAYSAHSLRSGFVTEAARQGVSMGETMAMTGHRSTGSLVGYFQQAALIDSRGSRLLEVLDEKATDS